MQHCDTDLEHVIRRMLENELRRPEQHKFLPEEDLKELLDEEMADEEVRCGLFGYPTRPLYKDISQTFKEWIDTKCCPMDLLPAYHLLDEQQYDLKRREMSESLESKVFGFKSLSEHWSDDEKMYNIRALFVILGKRGLMDMLGLRKTVGSKDLWPPPRAKLEMAFRKLCSPETNSCLTVGARALSKHAHRDSSSSYWGVCTGSESYKNDHAWTKLLEILSGATWINIHGLPEDLTTIETRQDQGYGLRWTYEDGEFRGFLEPQMEEGHKMGWKH